MGWGALGCSNLTASGARGGVARDVTVSPRDSKELHTDTDPTIINQQ